jgi:hypothetical protein
MSRDSSFPSAVKQRDGYTCVKCGDDPDSNRLNAHHIRPLSRDGKDDPVNGATLCNLCHRFAPDSETVIVDELYHKAFEAYASTWNPPVVDILWFGMQIAEQEEQSPDRWRKDTLFQTLPNLMPSNWWVICAAFADYKDAREWLPLEWPESDGEPVQTQLDTMKI